MESNNFEETLKRVEEIVSMLEKGDLSLEQSLAFYEEGINKLKQCYKILESYENKIVLLSRKDDGTVKEQPFFLEKNNSYSSNSSDNNLPNIKNNYNLL